MPAQPGWFSESAAQVASVGDIMFQGHWQWVSNALQATSNAVLNINQNAYPGYSRGARAGSGEGRLVSGRSGGFRRKVVRSRFTR